MTTVTREEFLVDPGAVMTAAGDDDVVIVDSGGAPRLIISRPKDVREEVSQEKLDELVMECESWRTRALAAEKDLQDKLFAEAEAAVAAGETRHHIEVHVYGDENDGYAIAQLLVNNYGVCSWLAFQEVRNTGVNGREYAEAVARVLRTAVDHPLSDIPFVQRSTSFKRF